MVGVDLDALGGHLDNRNGNRLTAGTGKRELITHMNLVDVGHLRGGEKHDQVLAVLAIGLGTRNMDGLLLAHLHILHGSIKAGNHLVSTAGELQRLATIIGAIELGAIIQRTAVVGAHLLAFV